MAKQVYLCAECGKRPQASRGWFLCWECEALWDAERTIRAAEQMMVQGRAKLANAQELMRQAEQPTPASE